MCNPEYIPHNPKRSYLLGPYSTWGIMFYALKKHPITKFISRSKKNPLLKILT
jgi:hypothetical protein